MLENLERITILNQYRYKYLKEFRRIAIMNAVELDFYLTSLSSFSKNLCHKGEFSYRNLCKYMIILPKFFDFIWVHIEFSSLFSAGRRKPCGGAKWNSIDFGLKRAI